MIMTWRVIIRRRGPGGEQIRDVAHVWALREMVLHVRHDPEVISYRYWRLRELAGVVREACECGWLYLPGTVREHACRCGVWHVEHECRECRRHHVDPPHGEGCGDLPHDAEGVNDQYHRNRQRWRPATHRR